MQAGKLNNRIIIQQLAAGFDEIGQPINTWSDVVTVWASIKHQNGAQAIKSGADVSIVQASIRIRRRAGITAGMRVLYGAIVYDIKAALPDESDKAHVDLVCQLVV